MEKPNYGGRWGSISYAQHGDDFVAVNIFELLGTEKPTYLELGAYDPFEISNTALMYTRGSAGVVVDASRESLERFEKQRPSVICVHAAVVPSPRADATRTFYRCTPHHGLNTCSLFEAESRGTKIHDQIEVPALTLDEIVKGYCENAAYPDFLSVDIEGYDYDVLATANFRGDIALCGPTLICVETRSEQTFVMTAMLEDKDYKRLIRMGENLFFIRKPLFDKVF